MPCSQALHVFTAHKRSHPAMTVWERFNTWWAVRRAKKALATSVPPLDMTEPEDVTLNDLVNSLEQTGKAALGAAVCVTDGDDSRWIWATGDDSLAALRAAVWRGWRPCGLFAAWPDPDNSAQVRLYVLTDLRTFKNLVVALQRA